MMGGDQCGGMMSGGHSWGQMDGRGRFMMLDVLHVMVVGSVVLQVRGLMTGPVVLGLLHRQLENG